MDSKKFDDYQKRMLNAMQSPNKQSNDPFTKLSNILENLKAFVNNGPYSESVFKQEVERQFKTVDSSDETAVYFKKTLTDFCSDEIEALKTISELNSMVEPISAQISSWSAVSSIAKECMAEIEKSIYHPT